MSNERKFADCYDIHRMKYFELDDRGRVVLKSDVADRIIDFHTHLGMTFLLGPRLNLFRKTDEVEYFFPYRGIPCDIDEYSALSFTTERRNVVVAEYARTAYSGDGFVRTQTIPNILDDMDRMRISHSVILALDYPWGISDSSRHYCKSVRHEDRLIPYASVHPYSANRAEKVRDYMSMGAAGIKLHPPQLLYRPTNPRLWDIYEACQEVKIPVMFHSGASPLAPKWQADLPAIKHFAGPVAQFPDLIFVFGHSGINEYDQVIELGKKHDNVYMELSVQPPERQKEIINGLGVERALYGSDWPFYPFELPLAKALDATEGKPEWREKILFKNAQRLLREYGGVEIQ